MEGVRHVGHDVGERLVRVFVQTALGQAGPVRIDGPDLQVGGAILRMQGGSDKLQLPVMVEVGDRIVPGILAVIYQQLVQLRIDQAQLRVNLGGVGRNNRCRRFNGRSSSVFRLCSGFCAAGSQGEKHCRSKQKSN